MPKSSDDKKPDAILKKMLQTPHKLHKLKKLNRKSKEGACASSG
jgi:hypothetical protein